MLSSNPRKSRGFIASLLSFTHQEEVEPPAVKPETLVRLQELCAKHTFVNVNFVDRNDCSFQSLILKVDVVHQSLLIDELFPMQADMSVVPGENIEITSSGKGLPVKFSSTIATIEMLDGSPAYRIALPRKVKANQRREFFRLSVSKDVEVGLRIPLVGGNLALCNVLNVSSSGVGFSIDKNISEQLQSSRILRGVKLSLPDSTSIYCDLEVKSYEYRKPPHRCTVMGARFFELATPMQKQLDKAMVSLQRDAKKAV